MNKNSLPNKTAAAAGLALAIVLLSSVVAAQADGAAPAKAKPYPLKKCVVDGNQLPKATKPYTAIRDGQEVALCCENCLPKFDQHSAKYLKKVKRAEKRAAAVEEGLAAYLAENTSSARGPAWSGW